MLAEAVPGQWDHPTEDQATAQLDREYDNIRAALQWTRDEGDVSFGLQLGVALWRFWRRGRHISEGRAWLEALLARDSEALDGPALELRLRAIHQAAWLATDQHDFQHAAQLFEQARRLGRVAGGPDNSTTLLVNTALQSRVVGQYEYPIASLEAAIAQHRASVLGEHDPHSITSMGLMLYMLALLVREQGDLTRATALFKEGIEFYRMIGDREGIAQGQLGLLDVARDQGNAVSIRRDWEPILAIFREFGTQWAMGFTLNNLALAAYLDGDLAQASALSSESVALFRELQADSSLAEVLITRGHVFRAEGNRERAYEALAEALRLAVAKGPQLIVAIALEGLASLIAQSGAVACAVQVFAAAASLRARMGTPRRPLDQVLQTDVGALAQPTLDPETFTLLLPEEGEVPLDEMLNSLVLTVRSTATPLPPPDKHPLSPP
jgi:tetratricopeptide (TPR) repeat protein